MSARGGPLRRWGEREVGGRGVLRPLRLGRHTERSTWYPSLRTRAQPRANQRRKLRTIRSLTRDAHHRNTLPTGSYERGARRSWFEGARRPSGPRTTTMPTSLRCWSSRTWPNRPTKPKLLLGCDSGTRFGSDVRRGAGSHVLQARNPPRLRRGGLSLCRWRSASRAGRRADTWPRPKGPLATPLSFRRFTEGRVVGSARAFGSPRRPFLDGPSAEAHTGPW